MADDIEIGAGDVAKLIRLGAIGKRTRLLLDDDDTVESWEDVKKAIDERIQKINDGTIGGDKDDENEDVEDDDAEYDDDEDDDEDLDEDDDDDDEDDDEDDEEDPAV